MGPSPYSGTSPSTGTDHRRASSDDRRAGRPNRRHIRSVLVCAVESTPATSSSPSPPTRVEWSAPSSSSRWTSACARPSGSSISGAGCAWRPAFTRWVSANPPGRAWPGPGAARRSSSPARVRGSRSSVEDRRRASGRHHGARAPRAADRRSWPLGLPAGAVGRPFARSPGSPPRTTIEDTVVDLCTRAESRALPGLLTRAVQGRRTTAQRILACVEDRARVRHRDLLRDMLGDIAQGAESPLELRYLTEIERPHGIPRAKRQVRSRSGKEIRDLLYEEWATIVGWMVGFTSRVVSATWSATMRLCWAATSPCVTDGPTRPNGRARWPGRLPRC